MSGIKPIDFLKFCVSQGMEFNLITVHDDEVVDTRIINQGNIGEYEREMENRGD